MKKYLPGLFAIVLAMGLSSFTIKSSAFDEYYVYAADDLHYFVTTTPDFSCSISGPFVCRIVTFDTPDLWGRVLIWNSFEIGWKH